jgi:hypothetical protein
MSRRKPIQASNNPKAKPEPVNLAILHSTPPASVILGDGNTFVLSAQEPADRTMIPHAVAKESSYGSNSFGLMNYQGMMMATQLNLFTQVISKAGEEIVESTSKLTEQINKIKTETSALQDNPIEVVVIVTECRQSIQNILTWTMMAAAATLELSESLPELVDNSLAKNAREALSQFEVMFDSSLTSLPDYSMFGVYLKPETEQVSRAKALISLADKRLEEIENENIEASKDWGDVEQAAFERMNESNPYRPKLRDTLSRLRKDQEKSVGV